MQAPGNHGGTAPAGTASTGGVAATGGVAVTGGAAPEATEGDGGTIAGSAPGGMADSGGAGGAPEAGLVHVSGQVVTSEEHPIASVIVEIEGKQLVTDEDGRFETDAPSPYDLLLHHPDRSVDGYHYDDEPATSSDLGPAAHAQPKDSVFRFEPAPGAVTALRICDQPFEQRDSAPFCLYVFTDDSSVELARIRAHGLEQALTSQQLIRWNVESRAEAPNVNAFLDPSRSARAFTSRASGTEVGGSDRFFYQAPE